MFLHDWAEDGGNYNGSGLDGIKADFQIGDKELAGVNIILATYTYEDYSGDAFVLFERGGKLYEVNGSHCSCYGLEGQWEPEEVTAAALLHRLDNGELGTAYDYDAGSRRKNVFASELRSLLAGNDNTPVATAQAS